LAAKEWIEDKLVKVLERMDEEIAGFLLGDFGRQRARENAADRRRAAASEKSRAAEEARVKKVDESKSVNERIAERQRQLERLRLVRSRQAPGTYDEGTLRRRESQIQSEIYELMNIRGPEDLKSSNAVFNANITVNATEADGDGIADKTRNAVRELWDQEMRNAAAGVTP